MSIIPGRDKGGNTQDKEKAADALKAAMPVNIVRQQPPAPADPRALHPAALAHAAAWSDLCREIDEVKARNVQLNQALASSRDALQQRDLAIDFERQRLVQADRLKEKYQRFAIEINTALGDGIAQIKSGLAIIEKAQARAMEVAQAHEPAIERVEEELKKAVAAANEEPEEHAGI